MSSYLHSRALLLRHSSTAHLDIVAHTCTRSCASACAIRVLASNRVDRCAILVSARRVLTPSLQFFAEQNHRNRSHSKSYIRMGRYDHLRHDCACACNFFNTSSFEAGIIAPSGGLFLLLKSSHICSIVTLRECQLHHLTRRPLHTTPRPHVC